MPTQIDLLKKYGLKIRGQMGQHLLVDPNIAHKIVGLLELQSSDWVLEIGPGLGALTQMILQKPVRLTAVEKDPHFVSVLEKEIVKHSRADFHLLHEDFLKWEMKPWLAGVPKNRKAKVVSNLPYYITAPILIKLVEERRYFSKAVLMMQKEVAKRVTAAPATKDYGRLSLAVQYGAAIHSVFDVPPSCFTPQPDVQSSVVVLDFESGRKRLPETHEKFLFHLVRIAFSQRRKTLMHLLVRDTGLGRSRQELQDLFRVRGWREDLRGEQLSLEDFVFLSEALREK